MGHTIHLRGSWSIAEEGGRTAHSRNFGKPRLPVETERVWLICSSLPAATEVRLNDDLIASTPAPGPFAADVTVRLLERNTVSFLVLAGERPGEVALEIRPQPS